MYRCAQEFQRVLTDFQGCEEQLVSEAQDGMRKHVVFESSSLANQQYDLQMLFKVEMDECLGAGGRAGDAAAIDVFVCWFCYWLLGVLRLGRARATGCTLFDLPRQQHFAVKLFPRRCQLSD